MDVEKLRIVFEALRKDQKLPASCRPHKLSGNYKDYWECHIAPDWLLIYEQALILIYFADPSARM